MRLLDIKYSSKYGEVQEQDRSHIKNNNGRRSFETEDGMVIVFDPSVSALDYFIKETGIKLLPTYSRGEFKSIINQKLDELGFLTVMVKNIIDDDTWNELGTREINTNALGLMSPVFESAVVEIKAGASVTDQVAAIHLQYSWEHPRGSNGYSIFFRFVKNNWIVD